MGQSYRIRTELGVNKTINVQIDQEFEFLEILSLKLQQEDIYVRACSDYGVLVGRVTANNGLGVPNARVAVFIPIEVVDQSNPIITSIYPYKSVNDRNEDGYRYNLLPYEKSYSKHAATGTLPSRIDALTATTVVDIYDKYYKFTAKTNESGDYMIMGVPLGIQNILMDVDLSDIGEFSLTPQDLIRIGLATEAQVAGDTFKTSTDLNSLPQIISINKQIEISPLWGEPAICQIAINRLDFDLRDDANVDIQPTSVFMGSIYSTPDTLRIKGGRDGLGGKVRDNFGNLCELQAGPGQILAIRQTIQIDSDGNPILEEYKLEQNGNVIDGNGSWLAELPMNLDYIVTNEFGERVLSNDPTIGIPTKAKYRFKIKWQQSNELSEQTRRPYYLVPNVREYGWFNQSSDPNLTGGNDQLKSSYYFGLDWSGYTKGFSSSQKIKKLNEIIDCQDTFYQFDFNRVYTVSGLIDQYKSGGRGKFIGIKEIDSNECADSVNKFPVNEGFRNFDFIYFLFAIIFQVIQIIGLPLLILYHFVAWLYNNFAVVVIGALIGFVTKAIIQTGIEAYAFISASVGNPLTWNMVLAAGTILLRLGFYGLLLRTLIKNFDKLTSYNFDPIKLAMIQYPDCQACECSNGNITPVTTNTEDVSPIPSQLTQVAGSESYVPTLETYLAKQPIVTNTVSISNENYDSVLNIIASTFAQPLSGVPGSAKNPKIYHTTRSQKFGRPAGDSVKNMFGLTFDLPIGERINIYNLRSKFFDNTNKIKVTFATDNNQGFHYDNTLTVLTSGDYTPGDLITFVNPGISQDPNYRWTGTTKGGKLISGLTGKVPTGIIPITVNYATSQTSDASTNYTLPTGFTPTCVTSVTVNVTEAGTVSYLNCYGDKSATTKSIGVHTITDVDCIDLSSLGGLAVYTVTGYGDECRGYDYPMDIEYYQVLTAITVTKTMINNSPVYSLPGLATTNSNGLTSNSSFWNQLIQPSTIITFDECRNGYFGTNPTNSRTNIWYEKLNATYLNEFETQKVLILQRGVDPYSPQYVNKYGIGRILGHPNEDDVVITASTRVNVPIQKLPAGSTTTVQQHNVQSNIFYQSNFFQPINPPVSTPGLTFSAFTTPLVGFYGALDSNNSSITAKGNSYYSNNYIDVTPNGGVISKTSNIFTQLTDVAPYPPGFFVGSTETRYNNSDDLSGGAILDGNYGFTNDDLFQFRPCDAASYTRYDSITEQLYYSPSLLPIFSANPLSITTDLTVMRTDRLPSSDYADNGLNWNGSVSLLQQNLGFQVYNLTTGESVGGVVFSQGAETITADIEGQYAQGNVLASLNDCDRMVGLTCYSGDGTNFGIELGCEGVDAIDNGCYVMVRKPLTDLFNGKDFKTFAEWGFRYRFFYALCRGVLAQSFTNNWVNGSLFMFPIQVDRYFDSQNKPEPPVFPKKLIYFDSDTNNFYFRSSPYAITSTTNPFIGRPTTDDANPINNRNLLFPTTIVNLGMKDSFYDEITFEPSTASYVMSNLNPTSYSDTSDIVNLFVISRITDEKFLQQLIPLGDNSLNQLFNRYGTGLRTLPRQRIDADLAQMMSINSEFGVIPFSPEFYPSNGNPSDPIKVIGTPGNPTMGIFFSSTTFNLQDKDYISPGIINFRPDPNQTAVTYEFGIKSQQVPFYQWSLRQGGVSNIFGSEKNNWATTISDITEYPYQALSRRRVATPNYYYGNNTSYDIFQRGYIFSVTNTSTPQNMNYDTFTLSQSSKFLVGAPYHFYFGLIKGETALDKFKTKYGANE